MAWNRPKEREQGIGNREQGARKSPFRGLVAGVIVVLGAAVAAWWLWPAGERAGETPPPQNGRLIKEAMPATNAARRVATTAVATNGHGQVAAKESPEPEKPKYGWIDGKYISPDPAYAEKKRRFDERQKRENPYKHTCDLLIGQLVNCKPGTFVFPINYDARFELQFKKSLADPLVINPDDSEEFKRKKQNVIEAKAWMKEQMDNGASVIDLMNDARKELTKVFNMRQGYQQEILKLQEEGADRVKIKDYVDAANIILSQYDAEHIPMPHDESEIKLQYDNNETEE